MFLFSKKHKTPVSTYTDSYRPPCSVKKTIQEQAPQELWKENKFVTQVNAGGEGDLRQSLLSGCPPMSPEALDNPACRFCVAEKYNPVFVNEDKYVTWRTGPYNSAAWNKHSSYLPLPSKVESSPPVMAWLVLLTLTLTIPPLAEREVITNMLHRLPVYTVTGRGPFQGYYSPCSGRHYCLRGMDYYVDGGPAIRRHLHTLGERAVSPRAMLHTSTHHPQPSSPCKSLRWDTSHFKKTGGVQRGSYIIHPEFMSEAYSAPWHW
uniref:Sperm microtubule inner protein 6 n=1 Tax=Aquila chrysaetos chrysaetos TaxID=223781 RepID=A0A663FFC0_AQUCH